MIQRIPFLAIGFLATAWPAAAQQAALHDGRPALQITSVDGEANTYIDYGMYEGETVFRFLVTHVHSNLCNGYLYVSRSGIQYDPEFSPEFWNDAFDEPWADIKEVKRSTKKDKDGMTVRRKKRKYNFYPAVVNSRLERIHSAVTWGTIVDFFLASVEDFDAVVRQFIRLTADLPGYRFIPGPLSAEQTAAVESAESKARVAEEAGRPLEALGHYLAAVKALPEAPDLEVDWRVRSRLVELVSKLESPPAPTEEARRRMAFAVAALEGATTAAQYDKSLAEFYQALKAAPWWARLYFNTAMVLEQGEYYASARSHLRLYLLAASNAEDREAVQQRIYTLEYKANNQ